MKQHILPAVRLSVILLIVFAVIYPGIIWVVAQAAPNHGRGETIEADGKVVGYANEGQNFTLDTYFWSRPSAVNYNAAGSGGSNKAPNNQKYLQLVRDRLDTFLVHNPDVKKEQVPVELIMASGSGLDPDLSSAAAKIQAARIAKSQGLSEAVVSDLIDKRTEKPLLGMFGPAKVNVLKLNLDLDKLKK